MHATVESVQLQARKNNVSGYDLGCSSRYGVVWFLMEIVKTCPIYKQLTKSLPSHAHLLMFKHSFWLHLLGHLPLGSLLGTSRMHTMSVLFLIAFSSAQFSITMLRLALAHPNSWQKDCKIACSQERWPKSYCNATILENNILYTFIIYIRV